MTYIATETIEPMWDKLLHTASEGETLVITTNDVPVAELHLLRQNEKKDRPRGLAKGEFVLNDEFFDPLPDDLLRLFNGEEE